MSAVMELPNRYQGASRFVIVSQADRCVNWLKISGFEVLSVEASRITIRHTILCEVLEGVVDGYERSKHGERRFKMVTRWDCAVVWDVTPSKPDNAVVSLWKRCVRLIGGRS